MKSQQTLTIITRQAEALKRDLAGVKGQEYGQGYADGYKAGARRALEMLEDSHAQEADAV